MKFKVIENDQKMFFEEELNDFYKNNEVLNIQYKPVGLPPDENAGWNTALVFTALVTYKEKV